MNQSSANNPGPSDVPGGDQGGRTDPISIARRLNGDLMCIGCGYNLRGLSIRELCPECATPVRATLLGVVDPKAHELAPLINPRVSGIGLAVWAVGAWLAIIAVAMMRLAEVAREMLNTKWWPGYAPDLGTLGLIASGLGAITLIRPHPRVTRWGAVAAAAGVAAYVPLTLLYYHIYARVDGSSTSPFLQPGPMEFDRTALRMGLLIPVSIAILGLRTHARGLASRSVIVRTGRVDRQSMLALWASFMVAGAGDMMHVLGMSTQLGLGSLLSTVGTVLVSVGSVLVVVGATNIVLDVWRLWPVIVRRGVGLGDVLENNAQREGRTGP